ncbi:hypothetical protein [Paracoccus sp. (in: a-proteobacteria)]|uniref:hypothetical protein n=1 Tax=Paracoccus sp. TaxID=267 RepID=UPI003A8C84A3
MKHYSLLLGIALIASTACSQSAIEQRPWQEARTLVPISKTAEAITGAITLSRNSDPASKQAAMNMTFAKGTTVTLLSEGTSRQSWGRPDAEPQEAEIFRLSRNPGILENNNTLCGGEQPEQQIYAVFSENSLFGPPPALTLTVFQSAEPPFDINSPGLCGTFSYELSPVAP